MPIKSIAFVLIFSLSVSSPFLLCLSRFFACQPMSPYLLRPWTAHEHTTGQECAQLDSFFTRSLPLLLLSFSPSSTLSSLSLHRADPIAFFLSLRLHSAALCAHPPGLRLTLWLRERHAVSAEVPAAASLPVGEKKYDVAQCTRPLCTRSSVARSSGKRVRIVTGRGSGAL